MFDGEYASLNAIYNTKCVRVPKPIKVRTQVNTSLYSAVVYQLCMVCIVACVSVLLLKSSLEVVEHPTGKGWVFIMEHVEMRALSKFQARLGEKLAR